MDSSNALRILLNTYPAFEVFKIQKENINWFSHTSYKNEYKPQTALPRRFYQEIIQHPRFNLRPEMKQTSL